MVSPAMRHYFPDHRDTVRLPHLPVLQRASGPIHNQWPSASTTFFN